MAAQEVGAVSVLARVTDHAEGLATPAVYGISVDTVIGSTIDEPTTFARRITQMRCYLGAYTGAFREGDVVYLSGRLVHLHGPGDHNTFGIELTPGPPPSPSSPTSPADRPPHHPTEGALVISDPQAFASTAAYYARCRPHYPDAPGSLTLPLAEVTGEVLAVDPAAEMLDQGCRLAAERGVRNIRWIQGDAACLPELGLPPLGLIVMAKSFHPV
ncbi:class I SAM-dependent methyltransferase [Streptomyces tubercidicus]